MECSLNPKVPTVGTDIYEIKKTQLYTVELNDCDSVDCNTVLSHNLGTPSYLTTNIAFDNSEGSHVSIMSLFTGFTSWDDYFNNLNTGCCPITYCVLKTSDDGGSSWPNVLGSIDNVYMDTNNDILANRNIASGYSIQFKV